MSTAATALAEVRRHAAQLAPSGGRQVSQQHAASCLVCRRDPDELAEIEAAYVGWTSAQELAQLYEFHDWRSLQRHVLARQLDVLRVGELAQAYGRIVASGLAEQASPANALAALRQLEDLAPGIAAPSSPSSTRVTTWEQSVKVVEEEAGAESRSSGLAQLGPIGEADEPGQPDRAHQVDVEVVEVEPARPAPTAPGPDGADPFE